MKKVNPLKEGEFVDEFGNVCVWKDGVEGGEIVVVAEEEERRERELEMERTIGSRLGEGRSAREVAAWWKAKRQGKAVDLIDEVVEEICEMVSEGDSAEEACKKIGVEKGVFFGQLKKRAKMQELYGRALVARTMVMEAEMDGVLDDLRKGNIGAPEAAILINTMKYRMARLNPGRWGDRVEVEGIPQSGGNGGVLGLSTAEKLALITKAREEGISPLELLSRERPGIEQAIKNAAMDAVNGGRGVSYDLPKRGPVSADGRVQGDHEGMSVYRPKETGVLDLLKGDVLK